MAQPWSSAFTLQGIGCLVRVLGNLVSPSAPLNLKLEWQRLLSLVKESPWFARATPTHGQEWDLTNEPIYC